MDKIYSTITILLDIYAEHDPAVSQRQELVQSIGELFRSQYKSLFLPGHPIGGLANSFFLKNLIVKLFIFKKLDNMKAFDA